VRGIQEGAWVHIVTPHGKARARARLNEGLAPDVVCGQHGWWQACPEIGAPRFPATGDGNANSNLLIGHDAVDKVGGSVPMRAYVCDVELIADST